MSYFIILQELETYKEQGDLLRFSDLLESSGDELFDFQNINRLSNMKKEYKAVTGYEGISVDRVVDIGKKLCRWAADQGSAVGQYYLTRFECNLMDDGRDVIPLLKESAAKGYKPALDRLISLHYKSPENTDLVEFLAAYSYACFEISDRYISNVYMKFDPNNPDYCNNLVLAGKWYRSVLALLTPTTNEYARLFYDLKKLTRLALEHNLGEEAAKNFFFLRHQKQTHYAANNLYYFGPNDRSMEPFSQVASRYFSTPNPFLLAEEKRYLSQLLEKRSKYDHSSASSIKNDYLKQIDWKIENLILRSPHRVELESFRESGTSVSKLLEDFMSKDPIGIVMDYADDKDVNPIKVFVKTPEDSKATDNFFNERNFDDIHKARFFEKVRGRRYADTSRQVKFDEPFDVASNAMYVRATLTLAADITALGAGTYFALTFAKAGNDAYLALVIMSTLLTMTAITCFLPGGEKVIRSVDQLNEDLDTYMRETELNDEKRVAL